LSLRKLLYGALLLASLALAPPAAAATIQLGATAPPGTGNGGGCSSCEDFQVSTVAASPSYAVPAGDGGVITSWSVLAAPSGSSGPFSAQLLVFRPTSTPGQFTYVGVSPSVSPPPDGALHTYSITMVVDAGDVIGLGYTNVPAYLPIGLAGDTVGNTGSCVLTVGMACTPSPEGASLMSVAATLQTPTAAFTPSATSVAEGATVSFNGSTSTSPASITDYRWNFGDGTTLDAGTTATATHTFATPGAHSVSLTITDSNGDTNQTSATVTVLAPTPPPPSPTPTPSPQTPPDFLGVSLAGTRLSATANGKVTLKLACSSTATTSCRGKVALFSASGATPKSAAAHHHTKATRLGSASFTVASGETATEQIALGATGRGLLTEKHFSARALITATDGANRTVTTAVAVTVKLAVKSTHHAPLRASSLSSQAGRWFTGRP
jgi:PKD repeat protein